MRHLGVTLAIGTPSMLLRALQADPGLLQAGSRLRCLAFGGEPCPTAERIGPLWPADTCTRLFNIYGVTGARGLSTFLTRVQHNVLSRSACPSHRPCRRLI
jgi:hypothetical protein